MRQFLLFFLILIFPFCLQAQAGLTINPGDEDSYLEVENLDDYWMEFVEQKQITNTSASHLNVRWEFEASQAPPEWEFRVCDKNASYSVPNKHALPLTLAPGESTYLDLIVLPRNVAGCGEIVIYLIDAANPAKVVSSATFNICVTDDVSFVPEKDSGQLRVFPNPAVSFISLTRNFTVRQLWISNILGKRVKSFNTFFNGKYDISDLPDGIYLVSMVDGKGRVVKTIRVSKRSPRP